MHGCLVDDDAGVGAVGMDPPEELSDSQRRSRSSSRSNVIVEVIEAPQRSKCYTYAYASH